MPDSRIRSFVAKEKAAPASAGDALARAHTDAVCQLIVRMCVSTMTDALRDAGITGALCTAEIHLLPETKEG